jgi:hypothetical protein
MEKDTQGVSLITNTSVQAYFHDAVGAALRNQNINARDDTVHYIINLLSSFTRADQLFERTDDGVTLQPLAVLYAQAVETDAPTQRRQTLRRLGDVALFIAGVFADSLNRKVVDLDYYIAMGGNAYGYLSIALKGTNRGVVLSGVFDELSVKFQSFVDILSEVSEHAHLTNNADIMRLYEVWLRTGSKRAADKLRLMGIQPAVGSTSRSHH